MGNNLDILNKLMLDKEINRRERDMLIALKAFDFEDSNVISVGLQSLLDYFCIKNKKSIYSVLRTLQAKNYIRIEKKDGKKNIYVIIKDYLLFNNSEESRYADVPSNSQDSYTDVSRYEESGYTDVSTREEGRYADVTGNAQDSYSDVSSYEKSRYTDVSTKEECRYNNVSTSRNNIYINIINHWNSKRIGKVVSLNIKIIDSINKAMAKYSFDEIKKAIDNYANVYNSDYFYDFQWHLPYFLTRNNAIGKFVDNGDIWLRYKQKYSML